MALINCDFFSETLQVGTSMTVVLPQVTSAQIGVGVSRRRTGFPVLYLLHGLSDDHTAWQRYTNIERYATAAGLAVVMPAVHRSFYADEANGHAYWSFVSQELPAVVADFFAVSTDRDDTFVAGLSMGGYGSLRLGLRQPERFAAVAALSSAVDIASLTEAPGGENVVARVFADGITDDDDIFALVASADVAALPSFYIGCGIEDEFLESNKRLVSALRERGAQVWVDLRAGGHEWSVWDAMIADVIAWLPLKRD